MINVPIIVLYIINVLRMYLTKKMQRETSAQAALY